MALSPRQQQALQNAAIAARQQAYAPYSKFYVGAALWLKDGRIVTGANVENASFGLSLCAERVAVGTAVAQGILTDISCVLALAVAADAAQTTPPCGACRQVLYELCQKTTPILLVNIRNNARHNVTLEQLLPCAFDFATLR